MHEVFAEWNKGELDSYLIEITRDILAFKDTDGQPLVDKILDTAGQKGTGKWTVIASQDLGIPITLIAEAVYSRCVSALKDERVAAAKKLEGPKPLTIRQATRKAVHRRHPRRALRLEDRQLRAGLHAHARGGRRIQLEPQLRRHRADVARRLHHPQRVPRQDQGSLRQESEADEPAARPLFPQANQALPEGLAQRRGHGGQEGHSGAGLQHRAGVLTTSTAANVLPANLLQAQRDYFGAHTYERVDKPRGEFFHTNWTGHGGTTASSTYNA